MVDWLTENILDKSRAASDIFEIWYVIILWGQEQVREYSWEKAGTMRGQLYASVVTVMHLTVVMSQCVCSGPEAFFLLTVG